jgi:hypothetical protein
MYVMLEDVKSVTLHCRLADGQKHMVVFSPGKNLVPDDTWAAIVGDNEQGFKAHYGQILHPFESRLYTLCRPHLNEYNEEEMLEIVDNARRPQFLEHLLALERQRVVLFAPRRRVLFTILEKLPAKQIPEAELAALAQGYANYVVE